MNIKSSSFSSSRQRLLLAARGWQGTEELGKKLWECASHPLKPVVSEEKAACQEVVHMAEEPGFDLARLVPAPTNTPDDAGPYITLRMCYASHPDTGASDVTIHRLCIQGKDELSIFFTPGARHIGAMAERAEELGQALPISISIGVDPAIEIGPSEEHVSMAGIPTEASIYGMVEEAMPGQLKNVYCPSAGGGKYMAVLQFQKRRKAMRDGSARRPCLHFPRSASLSMCSWWMRMWIVLT